MNKMFLCLAILLGSFIVRGQSSLYEKPTIQYKVREIANVEVDINSRDSFLAAFDDDLQFEKASSSFVIDVYPNKVLFGKAWYAKKGQELSGDDLILKLYHNDYGNFILYITDFAGITSTALLMQTENVGGNKKYVTVVKAINLTQLER